MSRLGVYGNAESGCSFGAGAAGTGDSFGGGAASEGLVTEGFGVAAGRAFFTGSGFCCANKLVAARRMTAAAIFMAGKSSPDDKGSEMVSFEPWTVGFAPPILRVVPPMLRFALTMMCSAPTILRFA